MLETYGIPFPAESVDTVETEKSDWWERGPGGVATAGRPPRPRPSLAREIFNRVEWYPVQNVKNK
jgi:hypothetical protein